MSIETLCVQDVTIVTAGATTDRYENAGKDWATASRREQRGWLAQQARSENNDGREAQIGGWTLTLLPDADITGLDRVEWSGLTFEVVGPPLPAYTPRGLHHYEVALTVCVG